MAAKKISIQKDKLIDDFLSPVSKVTDITSILCNTDGTTAICNNDSNIILFAKNTDLKTDEAFKLNIYEIKRFIRLLNCIDSDNVDLEVTSNTLNYKSDKLKFKYHLAEDAMVPITKISTTKIAALTFDCKFLITSDKIQEILKFSSVVENVNKLYFTVSADTGVTAELTDQQLEQSDSISVNVVSEYEGKEVSTPLPINLDIFRLISSIKNENILVKINTEIKVLMFEIQIGNTTLKYIISSLVK